LITYQLREVGGFEFLVSRAALADGNELAPALRQLGVDLRKVRRLLPSPVYQQIRHVKFWVERADSEFPLLVYHPDATWLKEHGYNPQMKGSVEVGNLGHVIEWHSIQPMMALHELSHAYHDQVLGFDYPPIKAAYMDAVMSHRYESVPYVLGGRRRAYALTNEREYFAELSEAYFGRNDFFPFTREELKHFDPEGYRVLKDAWNRVPQARRGKRTERN
jgi:hypothetical protein